MNRKLVCYNLLFHFLLSQIAFSQTYPNQPFNEAGLPYIQNYTPENYNANPNNYGAVQDSLGILYFANGDGVLMYDGVNWDLIELPKKTWVISIAIDADNRIYVAGSGEFGYLEPNPLGEMKYVSLSDIMGVSKPDFSWVYTIHVINDSIYFRDNHYLIRWSNNQFKVWHNENIFDTSFLIDDELFINDQRKGLMRLENDELNLVENGEFFKNQRIGAIFPYGKGELLIGTLKEFYLYSNGTVLPFKTDLDNFIRENKLYSGIKLNNGNFAIATANGGMAVMDSMGRRKLLINKKGILTSLDMYSLFQDRTGFIWASLDSGISKVEYPSPYSKYDQLGLTASCYVFCRYKDDLYVGAANGLYRMEKNVSKGAYFEVVNGFKDLVDDFLPIGDVLLVAAENGIFQLKDNKLSRIGTWIPRALYKSNLDSKRVFVALPIDGVGSLYYQNGIWIQEGVIEGVKGSYNEVIEDSFGNLWLDSSENWISRISFENKEKAIGLEDPIIEKFGPEQGLPDDRGSIIKVNGPVFFKSLVGKETFEFDTETKRFRPDNTLNTSVGLPNRKIYIEYVDDKENIFFSVKEDSETEKHYAAWKIGENKFKIQDLREARISKEIGQSMFVEISDSIIWHGGENGVLRYDLKLAEIKKEPFRALLKKVTYKGDSLLVAGAYHDQEFELPYKNNSFRFEYAAPSFHEEKVNTFQFFLNGFDENWSIWSLETKKDYTNLTEGSYTFSVRAKNIFGELSEKDNYSFTILPPWYRTWWSYLLYALLFILILWLYNRWRSQQLHLKNLALEAIISERTEEIRGKNELLGQQTERLKEMDTMKTRLFANISHEFRTPLTLIKGPIEKLEQSKKNEISSPNIKMIRRNTDRLLNLVNQLLDLSKLESGKMQLDAAEGDVLKCIRTAASAFSSHAAARNIDYQIKVPSAALWASFDRDKLEKILYNLLSNAFKFTNDQGRIVLAVEYQENTLHVTVSDSGHGIEKGKLPYIFDRFYQVDSSYTREKTGTGIGLALTKELVGLMNGALLVESELGRGTTFKMCLPIEKIESNNQEESRIVHSDNLDVLVPSVENDISISDPKASKILIIEDNNDMRFFIKEQLMTEYELFEAVNGKEGLEKAAKIMPDLIITDLMMPQMDGITLCKMLKTNIGTSHIPIIMLTAKAGIENKLVGLETGADDYLTKPFNARELLVRAKNLIGQRQKLRELFSKNISLNPKEITVTSVDENFLLEVLTLLEERYSDSEFGVPQMQRELGMGKTQLHMKIKALTNQPPGELLRNFRLKRATQLLSNNADNISQVAYSVGFNSLSYFTKCFKEFYGSSPSKYINRKEL